VSKPVEVTVYGVPSVTTPEVHAIQGINLNEPERHLYARIPHELVEVIAHAEKGGGHIKGEASGGQLVEPSACLPVHLHHLHLIAPAS